MIWKYTLSRARNVSNGLSLGGVSMPPLYRIALYFGAVLSVAFGTGGGLVEGLVGTSCVTVLIRFFAAGFLLSSSVDGVLSCVFFSCSVGGSVLFLSGVVGGVGWRRRLGFAATSGVMAGVLSTLVFVGVPITADAKDNLACCTVGCVCALVVVLVFSGVPVAANANFVCLAPFVSISFACVTLVCLVFSPRLGDECLPVVPDCLRRLPMVNRSRNGGTLVT